MFKRIVTGLMAAATLLPATVSAQDRDGRGRDRVERRADRPQRDAQQPRRDRGEVRRDNDGPRREVRGDNDGPRREDRRQNDGPRGDQRDRDRDRAIDGRRDDRAGWDRGNYNRGNTAGQRWNNGWRNDRRYDWSGYRASNRNAFRLPRYYAPRGWSYGYRRFGIGSRLATSLFASSYWIADPWSYRLPPAYGPYRWVRYYGDAVLVDIRTGYVVDSINGIFW